MSAIHMRDRYYPQYIVMESSNNAQGFDENGSAITDVDDFGTTIDALVALAGANGPCDIKVKSGTYTIPAAGDATLGKNTHLKFSPGCKLDVTGNLTDGALVISNALVVSDWSIEGPVEIDLNGNNGAGIYSDFANGDYCLGQIKDVKVDAVAATFAGVDLYRAFYMSMENVWVRTNGVGFRFRRQTDSVHYGNSYFRFLRATNLGSNDVIGLHIQGSGGLRALNLCEFHRYQMGGNADDGQTGTIGIRIEDDADISFYQCDIEGIEKGVHISDAKRILFYNPFIWSERNAAATRGVELDGDCQVITVSGGYIASDSVGTTWDDNTDALSVSRHMCLLTDGVEIYAGTWSLGNRTRCDKAILWNNTTSRRGYSENSGIATILNGNNSVVVVHNLAKNPITNGGSITLTGTHAEVAGAIITAIDNTDFTIGTPGGGNVTANRDVHWRAWITG